MDKSGKTFSPGESDVSGKFGTMDKSGKTSSPRVSDVSGKFNDTLPMDKPGKTNTPRVFDASGKPGVKKASFWDEYERAASIPTRVMQSDTGRLSLEKAILHHRESTTPKKLSDSDGIIKKAGLQINNRAEEFEPRPRPLFFRPTKLSSNIMLKCKKADCYLENFYKTQDPDSNTSANVIRERLFNKDIRKLSGFQHHKPTPGSAPTSFRQSDNEDEIRKRITSSRFRTSDPHEETHRRTSELYRNAQNLSSQDANAKVLEHLLEQRKTRKGGKDGDMENSGHRTVKTDSDSNPVSIKAIGKRPDSMRRTKGTRRQLSADNENDTKQKSIDAPDVTLTDTQGNEQEGEHKTQSDDAKKTAAKSEKDVIPSAMNLETLQLKEAWGNLQETKQTQKHHMSTEVMYEKHGKGGAKDLCGLCETPCIFDRYPCRICGKCFHKKCVKKSPLYQPEDVEFMERAKTDLGWSCYNCDNPAHLLEPDEHTEMSAEFEECDINIDSKLSLREYLDYRNMVHKRNTGQPMPQYETDYETYLFHKMDADGNGEVTYDEFVKHAAIKQLAKRDKKQILKLLTYREVESAKEFFDAMDKDHDGCIVEKDARNHFRHWYSKMDKSKSSKVKKIDSGLEKRATHAAKILMEADEDGDEVITWSEFLKNQALQIISIRPNKINLSARFTK